MAQVSPWIHRTPDRSLAFTSAVPLLAAIPVTLLGARHQEQAQAGCAPEEVISRWTCSRKTEVGSTCHHELALTLHCPCH